MKLCCSFALMKIKPKRLWDSLIITINMRIIILLCLFPLVCQAQLNKNIWKASAIQSLAGFADGTNQAYLFHYHGQFGSIRPNEEAWKNKWVVDPYGQVRVGTERFWLSSRSLVFLTDFHHFTRFVNHRSNEGSALVYAIGHGIKRKKWYWYLADFSIMFSARSIGFYGSYNIIFK